MAMSVWRRLRTGLEGICAAAVVVTECESEDPVPGNHLTTVRVKVRLPQRIRRGEDVQAAIQMLDAMRRPFLMVLCAG